jgi:hypothetical protein
MLCRSISADRAECGRIWFPQPEIQYFDPKVKSFAHAYILIAFNILNTKHLTRQAFGTAIAPLFSPDPGPDAWVGLNWSTKLKG